MDCVFLERPHEVQGLQLRAHYYNMCDPYDTRGYYFYVPVLPELLTLPSPNGGVGRCFMGLRFIEECVGVLSDNSGPLMVGGNQIALNHRFYTFSVGTNSVHAIDGATTGDLQSFNFPVTVAPPPPVPLPGQPPLPAPHFTPELIFVVPQADGGYHLMNVPVRRHNTLVSVLCAASKQDLAKFKQTCFRMCREALGDIQSPQSDVSYYSLYMFSWLPILLRDITAAVLPLWLIGPLSST
jgi:hypothetical protein